MIVGIAGLSGSGKSTFARNLHEICDKNSIGILNQDNYYKSVKKNENIENYNFDCLEALNINLLKQNLQTCKKGHGLINYPSYCFKKHNVTGYNEIHVKKNTIIEGHILFLDEKVLEYIDLLIYLDINSDICLCRRLLRDIEERDNNLNIIIKRYMRFVHPLIEQIEPIKTKANLIINDIFDPYTLEIVKNKITNND